MRKRRSSFQPRFWLTAIIFLLEIVLLFGITVLPLYVPFFSEYSWLIFIILLIYDKGFTLFIVYSKSELNFKISWLALIIAFPFGGGLVYLLFANKFTTKRLYKKRYGPINNFMLSTRTDSLLVLDEVRSKDPNMYNICNYIYGNAYTGIYKNTSVNYYKLGQLGNDVILKSLKKAKKFIFIEYFIMQQGNFFDTIFDILREKAKEGVDIRMIYDDFGCSSKMSSRFYKEVRKCGIKCYPFNVLRPVIDVRQNNRDHRKILIVDGVIGFTGGINIADEYINIGSKFGEWKDNCIMLEGEGVTGLTNIFLSNWNLLSKNKKNDDFLVTQSFSYSLNKELDSRNEKHCKGYVAPFGEEPYDGEDSARNIFLQVINKASKSIYLSSPYLAPDDALLTALINAAKSGVSVNIIVPGIPDKKIIYQCTKSYFAILATYGVKIYQYTPGFNHEKVIVADSNVCVTGSINFDFRSFYHNFENGVFIYNHEVISDIEKDLKEMIEKSEEIDYKEYLNAKFFRKLYWTILRLFAILF